MVMTEGVPVYRANWGKWEKLRVGASRTARVGAFRFLFWGIRTPGISNGGF